MISRRALLQSSIAASAAILTRAKLVAAQAPQITARTANPRRRSDRSS